MLFMNLCVCVCVLQGCAAAAVFRLHWITHCGPGGTADIPRGSARVHPAERVGSLSFQAVVCDREAK